MNDPLRAQTIETLTWMIEQFDYQKEGLGINSFDSPQMIEAKKLLARLQTIQSEET